jgi:rod shape determining protein RodA
MAASRRVDAVLIVCSAFVAALGVMMVFSATRGVGPDPEVAHLRRQVIHVAIGAALMVSVALLDHRRLRLWSREVYAVACLALVAVLTPLGRSVNGSQSWLVVGPVELQPSEPAKLGLIVGLAAVLSRWRGRLNSGRLGVALAVAAVPVLLILAQPDLGTALVIVAITGAMVLVGGAQGRHLVALALVGALLVVGALRADVLADYQKHRLTVFLDPTADLSAQGYNLHQSMTAVSRGGLSGDGLFQGRQTQLRFVPEQQTDFIFTVVAEELGFVGSATFLALMGVILWRVWRTAAAAADRFGQLLCTGVLVLFSFQTFQSVGMATGIMPVTGIPLPLMSYGGSTTLSSFAALGLVVGVHLRGLR